MLPLAVQWNEWVASGKEEREKRRGGGGKKLASSSEGRKTERGKRVKQRTHIANIPLVSIPLILWCVFDGFASSREEGKRRTRQSKRERNRERERERERASTQVMRERAKCLYNRTTLQLLLHTLHSKVARVGFWGRRDTYTHTHTHSRENAHTGSKWGGSHMRINVQLKVNLSGITGNTYKV